MSFLLGRNSSNNKVSAINITDNGELKTVSEKIVNNQTLLNSHSVNQYTVYTSNSIDMTEYNNILYFYD
jgi:hypothetical protein